LLSKFSIFFFAVDLISIVVGNKAKLSTWSVQLGS
jgi:hypothetical protein